MSRRPYECFKCRDSGFPNTMVYLAGKDDQGRTIQLEEDGTHHTHKSKGQDSSSSSSVVTSAAPPESTAMLKIISAKLDRIITMLSESQQQ